MRTKPMVDNEEQTEIHSQDEIFIMADRYEREQQLMFQMMTEYMEERKATVKFIEDIEFEEINQEPYANNTTNAGKA